MAPTTFPGDAVYQKILLATDGSDLAQAAAEHGIGLAKALGCAVLAVYASPPFSAPAGFEYCPLPMFTADAYTQSTQVAATRYLGAVSAAAERAAVPCTTRHVRGLTAAQAILAEAHTEDCDLVVVGSHGRTALSQIWLGSVTTSVLATSALPVLVFRKKTKVARKRKA